MRRSWRSRAAFFSILGLLAAAPALAAPDLADKFFIGPSGTDHKPQSKLWFNDGAWWAIVYDGSVQRMWKFENGAFSKQIWPDAVVDDRSTARADVLWDGTYLYVMMWHDLAPKFSQYSYDPSTQTYKRLAGFPVTIPVPGTEVMVIDKDSTGRIWASFELNLDVHVIWTTSPDHLSWNTTGTVLASGLDADDITTTIAFGGDKVGIFWSDQGNWLYGFRVHHDGAPPETWDPVEIVDSGTTAIDDHLNAKASADGHVYVAAKDFYNHIHLYVRAPAGGWTRAATNINGGSATRPTVQIDTANGLLHVFYTDWLTSPNPIKTCSAPLATLAFGTPEVYLNSSVGSFLNDVTGSKQILSDQTGIMIMASGSENAYWGFNNLDVDPPSVQAVYPLAESPGVPVQPLVQFRLLDAGMGVRRSSIAVALDGVPIVPTISGNTHEYLFAWSPASPLDQGRIYTVTVAAQDNAYPAHALSQNLRFRTEMAPLAVSHKINFQPLTVVPPPGYEAHSGAQYTLDIGKGWDKSTINGVRAGVHSDLRLDTYVDRKNSLTKASYKFDVPNGVYRVSFVAGAPNASGKQRVEVEGVVLLNNQVTATGQFLTVTDYAAVVLDGQLRVTIGGAGGSTKTQLCYLEFRYEGAAPPPPPPPPPGGDPAPRPVASLGVSRSGSDLVLRWNAVTEDTTGAVITVSRYHVYRGSTSGFLPDRDKRSNRVGIVSGTTYTDVGAWSAPADAYYLVTAERLSGTEARRSSNLALKRAVALVPPAGGTVTTWMALPYDVAYGTAQGLTASMNGTSGAGPVARLARVDRNTQQLQSYAFANGVWGGSNFALIPGEAYEVTVTAPLQWNLLGAEASASMYGFAYRTEVGNLRWVSLPENAAYADARSLVAALNGASGAGPVTKVAQLNPLTMQMESWLYFAGGWRGNNFALRPATGVAVLVNADLPSWSPRLAQP